MPGKGAVVSKVGLHRTRTRTNTNPDDTEANAAGRSGRACVAQSDGRRGGERVQRPVGALARVCVSGPQNRKRSQEGINPPSELSRSLSRHNHGAAGGGHPIIELPCILYQTPRTLIRERFFTGGVAGFCGSLQLSESLCSVPRRTWPTPVTIQEP